MSWITSDDSVVANILQKRVSKYLIYLSDYALGSTYSCHNRACTNGRVLPNGNLGQDDRSTTNIAIIPNRYAAADGMPPGPIPPPRIDGHAHSKDTHVWTDNAARTDGNGTRIHDGAIRPNDRVITNVDIVAIIAVEGSLDADFASDVPNRVRRTWRSMSSQVSWFDDGAEETGAFFSTNANVGIGTVVEAPESSFAHFALLDELCAEGQVRLGSEHFVLFGAMRTRLWRWRCTSRSGMLKGELGSDSLLGATSTRFMSKANSFS